MKKILLITTILMGSLFAAKAQDDQPGDEAKRQEKIKALYVAYITQELNLNADEAQKFWPLHAQFETDIKAVKPDMPELEKKQTVSLLAGNNNYNLNFTGLATGVYYIYVEGPNGKSNVMRFVKN